MRWHPCSKRVIVLSITNAAAVAVLLAACAGAAAAVSTYPVSTHISREIFDAKTSSAKTTSPNGSAGVLSCGKLDLWTTPPGRRVTITTTLGPATATLDGTTATGPGGDIELTDPVMTLAVDGRRFSERVAPPAQAQGRVIPWAIAPLPARGATTPQMPNSDSLCLASFGGGGLPTVMLGLFTGGAHCCTLMRAIALTPAGPARAVDDDLGNAVSSLSRDDGHAVIVTADNAFAYAFTDFADSGMPVRVLQFSSGRFVGVTNRYLALVAKDAAMWWRNFNSDRTNGLGLLAAWVADECVLGRGQDAWATVAHLEAEGRLVAPANWPHGNTYVRELKSFLQKHGYCS